MYHRFSIFVYQTIVLKTSEGGGLYRVKVRFLDHSLSCFRALMLLNAYFVSVENFFLYIVSINKSSLLFASVTALNFFLYIGWRNHGAIFGFKSDVIEYDIK